MTLPVVLMVLEVSPGREAPGKKPQVLRTPLGSKNPGPLLVAPLGPGLERQTEERERNYSSNCSLKGAVEKNTEGCFGASLAT